MSKSSPIGAWQWCSKVESSAPWFSAGMRWQLPAATMVGEGLAHHAFQYGSSVSLNCRSGMSDHHLWPKKRRQSRKSAIEKSCQWSGRWGCETMVMWSCVLFFSSVTLLNRGKSWLGYHSPSNVRSVCSATQDSLTGEAMSEVYVVRHATRYLAKVSIVWHTTHFFNKNITKVLKVLRVASNTAGDVTSEVFVVRRVTRIIT